MLNNDTGIEEKQDVPGQWAQIVGQVVEKVVSGTNVSTTIEFDNLEVDVPKGKRTRRQRFGRRYLETKW